MTATLSFYLYIETNETKSQPFDTLRVQLRDLSNRVLVTLATYTNMQASLNCSQKSFDLSGYRAQSILTYLLSDEDSMKATSFVVDGFSLSVQ